ncbi:MAG: hypothetical protein I3275_05830 [Candidatus Moeniiplasma glomeromycotorum]|nr:hypothetical protein [Candidatus Moeniiplasma glomeromycotorum]
MNQPNQNIIRNRNCLQCYKIEKKLPEKWEHFQNIILNSRIFTILVNNHTEIKQVKPMLIIGSFDGSFNHIHPANPKIYYQRNYKIIEWKKSDEPRKIVGYNLFAISDLIQNQNEYYLLELKNEKEWENISEFYRDLFNKGQIIFEKTEYIQDFLKEFQWNKLVAGMNNQSNITNRGWMEKQTEVRNLINELKETKIKCDKLFDLCVKLIEKILDEKQSKTKPFWEKMKQVNLILETIGIPANIIFSIIEIFKKNNKGSS